MKIEEYISELLYEHDCVIVPDFGGFVCNYAPARIDAVKHLFEPPGKRILFNKGLTHNDGLLAHTISAQLKLSYSQALETIAKEVKRYKEEIRKDKRLILDNIGLLYIDEKGSLLFRQDNKLNYLTESFGLAPFYYLPADEGIAERRRRRRRAYAAAAIIAALAVATFCFTLLGNQTNMRFSSLNFFAKKEISQYAYSPGFYKDLPKPVFSAFNIPITNSVTFSPVKPIVPAPKKTIAVKSSSTPVTSPSFSIIVGCFMEKQNADNLVNQFSKQNIRLSIIGKNAAGLYVVGYGKFASHDAAAAARDNFRKIFVKDAWIMAY